MFFDVCVGKIFRVTPGIFKKYYFLSFLQIKGKEETRQSYGFNIESLSLIQWPDTYSIRLMFCVLLTGRSCLNSFTQEFPVFTRRPVRTTGSMWTAGVFRPHEDIFRTGVGSDGLDCVRDRGNRREVLQTLLFFFFILDSWRRHPVD